VRRRAIDEWDYLLGVHDETRLGALRCDPSAEASLLIATPAAAPSILPSATKAASECWEQHIDEETLVSTHEWAESSCWRWVLPSGRRPKASVRDEGELFVLQQFPAARIHGYGGGRCWRTGWLRNAASLTRARLLELATIEHSVKGDSIALQAEAGGLLYPR